KEPKEPKEPREPREPKAPRPPPEDKESSSSGGSAPADGGDGLANLKASDTAEVMVDGRKVGPSPKLNYKLKAGKHKVRFDCYDENGNLKPGKVQNVEIAPDEEKTLDYECPVAP